MITKQEVLNDIQSIKKKTDLLANPLYNDAGGSSFWSNINEKLNNIENLLKKEIERYGK